MFLLKVVNDFYVTSDERDYLLCRWNGYSYENRTVKASIKFRNLTDSDRIPKFTNIKRYKTLADCFDGIYVEIQKYAFYESETISELVDILRETKDSIVYLKSKVESAFEQDKKNHKRKIKEEGK